jgi:prepilin-type N-terminal cleavage/methylation domain-containing protein
VTMGAYPRVRRRKAGFSLIELLVATSVAVVVLSGGWAWCWSVSRSCAVGSERLDAGSSIAFARRLSTSELSHCVALVTTPAAGCSATSIAFAVPSADGPSTELVTYVWDAGRRVLWRKAPGSHLAEAVDEFSIAYYDDHGEPLPLAPGAELSAAGLALVRRVELRMAVRCASQTAGASWQVCLRCPA